MAHDRPRRDEERAAAEQLGVEREVDRQRAGSPPRELEESVPAVRHVVPRERAPSSARCRDDPATVLGEQRPVRPAAVSGVRERVADRNRVAMRCHRCGGEPPPRPAPRRRDPRRTPRRAPARRPLRHAGRRTRTSPRAVRAPSSRVARPRRRARGRAGDRRRRARARRRRTAPRQPRRPGAPALAPLRRPSRRRASGSRASRSIIAAAETGRPPTRRASRSRRAPTPRGTGARRRGTPR